MALDILGPANAPNAVTVRPPETRIFGALDTFFKPCTTPGSLDGTAVQAVFLNGMLQQLRRAIRGMGVAEDNADNDMLLKAIQAVGTGLVSEAALLANMPVHAALGTSGLVAHTVGAGQIVVSTGQSLVRRGVKAYAFDDISLANRTFATVASKTYHLRWYAPGIGRATPASSWPAGRLYLEDLADPGYNPSALAEAASAFDAGFDNVLLARVVTNGANALTVTPLAALPWLSGSFSRTNDKPAASFTTTHGFNWNRTPSFMALRSINPPGGSRDTDATILAQGLSRYDAQVYSWAWSDEMVAGTQTAPAYGYTFNVGA